MRKPPRNPLQARRARPSHTSCRETLPGLTLLALSILGLAASAAGARADQSPAASARETASLQSPRSGAEPASSRAQEAESERIAAGVEHWRGRHCPATGCTGVPGNSLANGAGFAASALAGAWIARRRGPTRG